MPSIRDSITIESLSKRYDEPTAQFLMNEIAKAEGKAWSLHDEAEKKMQCNAIHAWTMPTEPLMPMIGEIELLERIFTKARPSQYTRHYQQIIARRNALEKLIETTPGQSLTAIIWKVDKLIAGIREDEDRASAPLLRTLEAILDDLIRQVCKEQ